MTATAGPDAGLTDDEQEARILLERAHRMGCSDPDDPTRVTLYSQGLAAIDSLTARVVELSEQVRQLTSGRLCPECNAKEWNEASRQARRADEALVELERLRAATTDPDQIARQALLEAAEEYSDFEVVDAADGHRSIRTHGLAPSQWLTARAEARYPGPAEESAGES